MNHIVCPSKQFVVHNNGIIYLFINYNTITNYILIIYELSNLDHVLGVVADHGL